MKIKKDDNVLVIAGKDKGKKASPFCVSKNHQALIEGVNIIKTHSKAKAQVKQAGIIERKRRLIYRI